MESLRGKKILIVRLSSIGDVVHTLPLLNALKTKCPTVKVSWLVENESAFLVKDNPMIDSVFVFEKSRFRKEGLTIDTVKSFLRLVRFIRDEKFDIVIDAQGLFKSGFLAFLSAGKRKIGFKNTREFAEYFLDEKVDIGNIFSIDEHVIIKNLKLAEYIGLRDIIVGFPLPEIKEEVVSKIDSLMVNINKERPLIVVISTTRWESKHWKKQYWKEVLFSMAEKANIIFIGAEEDNKYISSIIAGLDLENVFNFAGKTTLLELIELFKRVDLVIGLDTGPLHLAVAVNKPRVLSLMGATSHVRTGALGHNNLYSGVECSPCNKKVCPLEADQNMKCMSYITPEMVVESALTCIHRAKGA